MKKPLAESATAQVPAEVLEALGGAPIPPPPAPPAPPAGDLTLGQPAVPRGGPVDGPPRFTRAPQRRGPDREPVAGDPPPPAPRRPAIARLFQTDDMAEARAAIRRAHGALAQAFAAMDAADAVCESILPSASEEAARREGIDLDRVKALHEAILGVFSQFDPAAAESKQ
jgi:hypothetical protein